MGYFGETAQSVGIDLATHAFVELKSALHQSQNIAFKALAEATSSLTLLSDVINHEHQALGAG